MTNQNAKFHRETLRNSLFNQFIFEDVYKNKELIKKYKKQVRKIMGGLTSDDIFSITGIVIDRMNTFSIFAELKQTTFDDLKNSKIDLMSIVKEYKKKKALQHKRIIPAICSNCGGMFLRCDWETTKMCGNCITIKSTLIEDGNNE